MEKGKLKEVNLATLQEKLFAIGRQDPPTPGKNEKLVQCRNVTKKKHAKVKEIVSAVSQGGGLVQR